MDKNHWLGNDWNFNPQRYAEELLLLLENAPDGQQKTEDVSLLSTILRQEEGKTFCREELLNCGHPFLVDPPEEWDYAYHLHCRVEKAVLGDTRWEDWNKQSTLEDL
jgi:hypothetical protein